MLSSDMNNFNAVNKIYGSFFSVEDAPARVTVEVSRLPKDVNVEISDDSAEEIAGRSRGTPRVVNSLLRRVRDFAQVKGTGNIDIEIEVFNSFDFLAFIIPVLLLYWLVFKKSDVSQNILLLVSHRSAPLRLLILLRYLTSMARRSE